MTYIADLDPENPARLAAERAEEVWDEQCPDWRDLSLDPEDRRFVDYTDVRDPDEDVVAVPDWRVIPGA